MKNIILFFAVIFSVSMADAKTGLYRLIIKSDPASSMTIGWVQFNGRGTKVLLAEKEYYLQNNKFQQEYKKVNYIRHRGIKNGFVTLENLKPGTWYAFKIVDDNSSSEVYYFTTVDTGQNVKLSVIAGGDSRTNREIRIAANKMVAKLQPDFVIFDGDFTYSSSKKQWLDWLTDWQLTIGPNKRLIPIMVVPGNHEKDQDVVRFFDLTQFPNGYYSLNIAGDFLHLVSLNTQFEIPGMQTDWFYSDLEAHKDDKWTIVAYHKPMRPHYSRKREGDLQYKYWALPIYQNNVPLVLEGDTHTCKVTWPVKPDTSGVEGFVRDDQNGTVYVGEGCWGAPLRPADDIKPWTRDADAINQFKLLWIDKDKIEIRTVKYENVDKVESLSYQDRFILPQGIELWTPKNGAVVVIKHK